MKKIQLNSSKLQINKKRIASLNSQEINLINGGVIGTGAGGGGGTVVIENPGFLSMITCKAENGSHCQRCDSCCVGTMCSR